MLIVPTILVGTNPTGPTILWIGKNCKPVRPYRVLPGFKLLYKGLDKLKENITKP